ncbi:MAG: haloacid dehalogenase-like hydrolase [Polynucleobacter sp.]|nr:haloacid dehalogenase-like hydrolase [Polynucleobacter sp.]
MHLGLDFDNTLISYDVLFRKVALEQHLIPQETDSNKNAVRDYLRSVDREDEWTRLQGEVYGSRILEATPYPGMKQALQSIAGLNIPLTIVSHKTKIPFMGKRWDLHAAARTWLNQHGMNSCPGPNISHERTFFEITKQAKCDRILAVGCTHYVDDLPEILEMLPETVTKILFSPEGYSTLNGDWLVMRSWGELPTLLGLDL